MRGVWLLLLVRALHAQEHVEPEPHAAMFALRRATAELVVAESTLVRTQRLHARRLVSEAELELRALEREQAALWVLERWSALAIALPALRVVSARKARTPEGAILVRVRIVASGGWPAGAEALELPPDVRARMNAATGAEAFLSIKDEPGSGGTAIGLPYERRVPLAALGSDREMEFRLLRDLDAIVVSLATRGRVNERKVWLESDRTGAINIQPVPYAQEADVGTDASYDLLIERFGEGEARLRLAIEGLPREIAYGFTDAETGARVGQLRFAAGEHQRRVRLTISVPRAEGGVVLDSAYRFAIVASPLEESGFDAEHRAGDPAAPGESGRTRKGGIARLELVARGTGRAELRAFNLFHELTEGTAAELEVVVRNAGSRVIDRVGVLADLPPGWSLTAVPDEMRDLEPGTERPVRLAITPASDVELGDYEVRLRVEGYSGSATLSADPTVLRLRVRGTRGRMTTVLLSGALLTAGGVALAASRRLARR